MKGDTMNKTKQRRYLIILTIMSFVLWVVTTFALMVLFCIKGGLSVPTTNTVPISLYQWSCGMYKSLIFYIIPGLTFGYFVVGALLLDFLAKTKDKSDVK
jgi:hypothetical protein